MTDAYNEVDDQFAIAYALRSKDKVNVKAIYAAPFFNKRASSVKDGMEKSYNEVLKVLDIMNEKGIKESVFRGSAAYLSNEITPVISDAALDLSSRAMNYTPKEPLYVIAIGAKRILPPPL